MNTLPLATHSIQRSLQLCTSCSQTYIWCFLHSLSGLNLMQAGLAFCPSYDLTTNTPLWLEAIKPRGTKVQSIKHLWSSTIPLTELFPYNSDNQVCQKAIKVTKLFYKVSLLFCLACNVSHTKTKTQNKNLESKRRKK